MCFDASQSATKVRLTDCIIALAVKMRQSFELSAAGLMDKVDGVTVEVKDAAFHSI